MIPILKVQSRQAPQLWPVPTFSLWSHQIQIIVVLNICIWKNLVRAGSVRILSPGYHSRQLYFTQCHCPIPVFFSLSLFQLLILYSGKCLFGLKSIPFSSYFAFSSWAISSNNMLWFFCQQESLTFSPVQEEWRGDVSSSADGGAAAEWLPDSVLPVSTPGKIPLPVTPPAVNVEAIPAVADLWRSQFSFMDLTFQLP